MLQELDYAPKTVNRRLSSVSGFFKYMREAAAEARLPIVDAAHRPEVRRRRRQRRLLRVAGFQLPSRCWVWVPADAPGGATSYVVNGEMTGGFAAVAYPAEYGNSGIMTFLVGPDGIVYEADFGADTPRVAAGIDEYDPDGRWWPVE
jgi:hypothetical protein